MNKNKKPLHHYRIFALITSDEIVYVGKTKGQSMSAVYRSHTKGKCYCTRNTIGQAGDNTQLFILSDIDACTSAAYRYVVAWTHIFLMAGYQVVNQPGVIDDAEDLYSETVRLVSELLTDPLEEILQRTLLERPSDADLPKETCETELEANGGVQTKEETVQLCVRLSENEKQTFNRFAEKMELTQRDALVYLLRKYERPLFGSEDWLADQRTLKAQKQAEKKIKNLQEELSMTKEKLEQALNANPENLAPKMTARYKNVQDLVQLFFEMKAPAKGVAPELPKLNYKKFVRSLPSSVRYEYPEGEGVYVFYPEVILYGDARPPVIFWLGRMDDGSLRKLRVYEKWEFVGVSPMHGRFSVQGMAWLVSVRWSSDGAMDLIAALPLGVKASSNEKTADKKTPLAQRIIDIESRI